MGTSLSDRLSIEEPVKPEPAVASVPKDPAVAQAIDAGAVVIAVERVSPPLTGKPFRWRECEDAQRLPASAKAQARMVNPERSEPPTLTERDERLWARQEARGTDEGGDGGRGSGKGEGLALGFSPV